MESNMLPNEADARDDGSMLQRPSTADLRVDFGGPALDTHEIEVDTLAPALIALAKAIRAAQRDIAPESKVPSIRIKATEGGSFLIDLVISVEPLLQQLRDLLTGDEVEAALNAAGLLSAVVGATSWAKWKLEHRGSKQVAEDADSVTWESPDGSRETVPVVVENLTQNFVFMGHMADAAKPLEEAGIDRMSLATAVRSERVELRDGDELAFDGVPGATQNVIREEILVDVKGLKFDGGRWQLNDGDREFTADMEDSAFITEVEATHRRFTANDMLKVRLRTEQYQTPSGQLRSRRFVEKVLEHRPYQEPPTLFD